MGGTCFHPLFFVYCFYCSYLYTKMNKHILSLSVPTVYNPGILVIEDTSIYTSLIPVTCETLQILYPGSNIPVQIAVEKGQRYILNACMLGILASTQCTDSCPAIPDGIYNIQYSVSPNSTLYVEYNHLRCTDILNRWGDALCRIDMKPCLPSKDQEYLLQHLYMIKGFIDSAKLLVENKHEAERGMNLLEYANHLLDKMSYKLPNC